jgi:hypothetical protein
MAVVDPTRTFEIKGQVCPIQFKFTDSPVMGAEAVLIAAQSGKRIRVMGGVFTTDDPKNIGLLQLGDGAGANWIFGYWPPIRGTQPFILPISDTGYFETSTGNALYVFCTTNSCVYSLFYIVYTP